MPPESASRRRSGPWRSGWIAFPRGIPRAREVPLRAVTAIQEDTRAMAVGLHQQVGNPERKMYQQVGKITRREKVRGPRRVPDEGNGEPARSGLGRRLDARIVLEELLVDVGVLLPL